MAGGLERQTELYLGGVSGVTPRVPLDAARLERRAGQALAPEAFAYIAAGAGNESTLRANRAAFERWRIVPRMLRDVSERDTSIELFGRRLHSPSCSRRSGSSSSPTARQTWRWPARPAPSACR